MICNKKIAIIGPINSKGGREIEAAFIASLLTVNNTVTLYSTEDLDKKNDLFLVNASLNIYKKYKNPITKTRAFFGLNIKYNSLKFKQLNGSKTKSIYQVLNDVDVVIIIAQLISNYTKEIITLANKLDKTIFFRTTGTIPSLDLTKTYFDYLEYVKLFINHSEENSRIFKTKKDLPYKVIDQCVFNEDLLIEKNNVKLEEVKKFYCVSRLDKNKDVLTVIKAFNFLKKYKHLELHIIGAGTEIENLKSAAKNENIKFYGHLDFDKMINVIYNLDCLIIASKEEAGPLNALEAMLLKKLIISTKVGAMPERFSNANYMWFKYNDASSLSKKIIEYSKYNNLEISTIQDINVNTYHENYSKLAISQAYLNAFSSK